VIQWALVSYAGSTRGVALAQAHVYEVVFNTVGKVAGRVRQIVQAQRQKQAAPAAGGDDATKDVEMAGANDDEETKQREIAAMRDLFKLMEDSLISWANGTKD
jgi:nuclear cap-binding protein subunit 1